MEEDEAGHWGKKKKKKQLTNVGEDGHRGVWVVGCWVEFFHLSFFLLKKKPPSCVIIFMGSAILAKICL